MSENAPENKAATPVQGAAADAGSPGMGGLGNHPSNEAAGPATEQTPTTPCEPVVPGHAVGFLEGLGEGPWLFQTVDDDKKRKEPSLTKLLYGSLAEHAAELTRLNQAGAGIFVTVNKTQGARRKAEDVTGVRAYILDLDGAPVEPVLDWHLRPHFVVLSSPGRYHCYWLVEDAPCEVGSYKEVQKALLTRFNGDPSVVDLPRVMRVPGFLHCKETPFPSEVTQWPNDRPPYTDQEIRAALAKPAPRKVTSVPAGNTDLLRFALSHVTAESRDRWIAYAYHIKAELGEDDGWDAFLELSQRSPEYKGEADCAKTWKTIDPSGDEGSVIYKDAALPVAEALTRDSSSADVHLALRLLAVGRADAVTQAEVLKTIRARTGLGVGDLRASLKALRSEEQQGGEGKKSVAAQLAGMVSPSDLWVSEMNEPFATIREEGRVMHLHVRGKRLREWLSYRLHKETGLIASQSALADAASALSGMALHEGKQHRAWLRVGQHDGKLYIDLGDPQWRAVEVDLEGWRVIATPPVRFRRGGAGALPEPMAGGDLSMLGRFLNTDAEGLKVIVSWMLSAFRPDAPCPILYLSGEQGAAKSTATKVIRSLVDPTRAITSSLPDKEGDLLVSAQHNWVVSYDNLSHISLTMSDAFCRLVYGASIRKRELYTDGEEAVIAAQRPCLLNGIGLTAKRSDLLERILHVTLQRPEQHRSDVEFWAEFEQGKGMLFGALLDALVVTLRDIGAVQARGSVSFRMGDYVQWTMAASSAIGWVEDEFLAYYSQHCEGMQAEAASGSAIVDAALKWFVENNGKILQGGAAELHRELSSYVDESAKRSREWPTRPAELSKRLRELARGLPTIGIEYHEERDAKSKTFRYQLRRMEFDPA